MESSPAELKRSAPIRDLAAVLISAGLTTLAILALWGALEVKTDVVGYPVFKDFNVDNYFTAYYLTIGLFPLLALLIFAGAHQARSAAGARGAAVARRLADAAAGARRAAPAGRRAAARRGPEGRAGS